MGIFEIALSAITPIVVFYLGTLERRLSTMKHELNQTMAKEEVRQLIEDKQEPLHLEQREIKEDLHRIERKLDTLLDRLTGPVSPLKQ